MEVAQLDAAGREQFRISRHAKDVIESHVDYSRDPVFVQTMANKVYYGPVYFVEGSEPHMTIAVAGSGHDHGVIVGQVNLKFIWEVVSQIKPGTPGYAYVVDAGGRLIADPDISLVLRNIDMSSLPQVRAARAPAAGADEPLAAVDRQGKPVLSAHATVTPLKWLVFVELPIDEAYAPLYESIKRSSYLLMGGLMLAFLAVGVWDDYGKAQLTVQLEANAASDVFRAAEGYPEAFRRRVREGIRAYIDIVLGEEWALQARGRQNGGVHV
jgi:hypothetical protein